VTELQHYRCLTCSHEWDWAPQSGDPKQVLLPSCSRCGAIYILWVDSDGWRERNPLRY